MNTSPCGPNGHPDWLLQRAGFTDAEVATYQKLRRELHWSTADEMAETFLILLSVEKDRPCEDEFLPGT